MSYDFHLNEDAMHVKPAEAGKRLAQYANHVLYETVHARDNHIAGQHLPFVATAGAADFGLLDAEAFELTERNARTFLDAFYDELRKYSIVHVTYPLLNPEQDPLINLAEVVWRHIQAGIQTEEDLEKDVKFRSLVRFTVVPRMQRTGSNMFEHYTCVGLDFQGTGYHEVWEDHKQQLFPVSGITISFPLNRFNNAGGRDLHTSMPNET